jgi:hypothetical protein
VLLEVPRAKPRTPAAARPPARTPGAPRPPVGAVCTTGNFTAQVSLRDRAGIKIVNVYLDGKLVKQTSLTRFALKVAVRGLRVGAHQITVVAQDRAGNTSVTRSGFGRCELAVTVPRFAG